MFETGVRQMRMALSFIWGRRIDPGNMERLIRDALKTLDEFGAPGDDVQQLLEGPFGDPANRRDLQTRALQRTARRLVETSPFYAERFKKAGVEPRDLNPDSVSAVPPTTKADLVARTEDFLSSDAKPVLASRTTGTTGRPAEIWLSRYELELWPAVSTLSGLLRHEISPADHMQVNVSSRATAATQENLAICRLVGARARPLGIIDVEESLDGLLAGGDRAPTLLATYPSYLAALVHAARRRDLGPDDFHLRRIDCGGEVLSAALARGAEETFGGTVNDTFGMTEVLPVSGRMCGRGHLHHDLNIGFVEVLDLDTGEQADPGDLGTVVITPYYPYRECMPVFRYDTRDLVRRLPEAPLGCELAGTPATSRILGKVEHLTRFGDRVVTTRDVVEAVEGLGPQAWPARYRLRARDGRLRLELPARALGERSTAAARSHFAAAGLDVELAILADLDAAGERELRTTRADLVETSFSAFRAPADRDPKE